MMTIFSLSNNNNNNDDKVIGNNTPFFHVLYNQQHLVFVFDYRNTTLHTSSV